MIGDGLAYAERRALRRLADLRDTAGWHFTIERDRLTGIRTWPDGTADLLAIQDVAVAGARRITPKGAVVWIHDGDLVQVVDALLTLPAPGDPGAPVRVIHSAPHMWTSE